MATTSESELAALAERLRWNLPADPKEWNAAIKAALPEAKMGVRVRLANMLLRKEPAPAAPTNELAATPPGTATASTTALGAQAVAAVVAAATCPPAAEPPLQLIPTPLPPPSWSAADFASYTFFEVVHFPQVGPSQSTHPLAIPPLPIPLSCSARHR
jgi:hypothetical protein